MFFKGQIKFRSTGFTSAWSRVGRGRHGPRVAWPPGGSPAVTRAILQTTQRLRTAHACRLRTARRRWSQFTTPCRRRPRLGVHGQSSSSGRVHTVPAAVCSRYHTPEASASFRPMWTSSPRSPPTPQRCARAATSTSLVKRATTRRARDSWSVVRQAGRQPHTGPQQALGDHPKPRRPAFVGDGEATAVPSVRSSVVSRPSPRCSGALFFWDPVLARVLVVCSVEMGGRASAEDTVAAAGRASG